MNTPDPLPPADEFETSSDIETRTMTVTFFNNEAAASARRVDLTLPQLAERIAKQCAANKMELPWLKLAIFGNTRERKELPAHQC